MPDDPPHPPANADQIEAWNTRSGEVWAAMQARIDAVFAPLTEAAFAAAAVAPGTAVLDVGCGCGTTVLDLAHRVGPAGRVLGVDVSRPMLGVAETRVAESRVPNASLALADAATHAFEPASFDLIFSRFGVMFFDDPVAAFRNLRTALRPDGRLFFVCWQPMRDNPWFAVPIETVLRLVPPQPPSDPVAPGPFAFADPERVRRILEATGFGNVRSAPLATTMRLAGPGDIAGATEFLLKVGPASRLVAEADPALKPSLAEALGAALAPYDGPGGVVLGGAVWLVSAQR